LDELELLARSAHPGHMPGAYAEAQLFIDEVVHGE
jgi:hypothetical protein